jgi:hypothetical protein
MIFYRNNDEENTDSTDYELLVLGNLYNFYCVRDYASL